MHRHAQHARRISRWWLLPYMLESMQDSSRRAGSGQPRASTQSERLTLVLLYIQYHAAITDIRNEGNFPRNHLQ